MDKDDRQAMMQSMMKEFFGGMGADEKKEICATMMGKMTEGPDMKEVMPKTMMGMMPKMMMGMMSGGDGDGPGKMKDMMGQMHGGSGQQMPEMMPKVMDNLMPHMIGDVVPLVTQPMITVDVRIEDRQDRLVGDLLDRRQQHLANLHTAARIDHDHALVGDDERRVVHETLIRRRWQFGRTVDHIHAFGDLIGTPLAAKRAGLLQRIGRTGDQQQGNQPGILCHQAPLPAHDLRRAPTRSRSAFSLMKPSASF